MLGFSLLKDYPNIFHFTTSRQGGVSEGNYGTLNGSYYSGDKKVQVDRNWEKIKAYAPEEATHLIQPYQTHGDSVLVIDSAFLSLPSSAQTDRLYGVDALVTNQKGVLLTVATADCVPLTLYDPVKQVAGVVHAGWRGTVKHLVAKTVAMMNSRFDCDSRDIRCGIGPSISLQAFEVGDEVVHAFKQAQFRMNDITSWHPESGKYHVDLWQANNYLLLKSGVKEQHISCAHICTYLRHEEFFSARRLGIKSGRIITGIQINKE